MGFEKDVWVEQDNPLIVQSHSHEIMSIEYIRFTEEMLFVRIKFKMELDMYKLEGTNS